MKQLAGGYSNQSKCGGKKINIIQLSKSNSSWEFSIGRGSSCRTGLCNSSPGGAPPGRLVLNPSCAGKYSPSQKTELFTSFLILLESWDLY
jgi:hypothetical protein